MHARGDKHHKWVPPGTRIKTKSGYIKLKSEAYENSHNGWIYEHVAVLSNFLGRRLYPNESVHHKNGVRDDNSLENLELWSHGQPAGQRIGDKIKWAKEFLEIYGYTVEHKFAENNSKRI